MPPSQPGQSEPFPREPIPPEILEWARQTFDEEEFLAHVREIEATGGRVPGALAASTSEALSCGVGRISNPSCG
jgi:hypothetical protein